MIITDNNIIFSATVMSHCVLDYFKPLLQIHCWDDAVPIEETMNALNDLIEMGKVRYIGASNLTGWQLQRIIDLMREREWHPLVSLQVLASSTSYSTHVNNESLSLILTMT